MGRHLAEGEHGVTGENTASDSSFQYEEKLETGIYPESWPVTAQGWSLDGEDCWKYRGSGKLDWGGEQGWGKSAQTKWGKSWLMVGDEENGIHEKSMEE